jgi:hypothetical protein
MASLTFVDKPVALLTLYKNGYIDFRDIDDQGAVGVSKPIYKETLTELISLERGDKEIKTFKGIIPSNLLYCNPVEDHYIWYKEAGRYKLQMKKMATYPLPAHVIQLKDNKVSVIAVDSMDMDSKCYVAPFSNRYGESGDICMGSAQINLKGIHYIEDVMEYVENRFYFSKFSNDIELKDHKRKKKFPMKELKELKTNLQDYVEDSI